MATAAVIACLTLGSPSAYGAGRFNGGWGQILAADPTPAPRRDMAVIYDPVRDQLVAVGGGGETWTLTLNSPTAWTRLPIGTGPSSGFDRAFYDAVGDRMIVLTASMSVHQLSLAEPTGWQVLTVAGQPPPGRHFFASAHDARRNRIFVYGGGTTPILGDFWVLALEGTPTWSQVSPAGTGPPPLWGAIAAVDPVGDRLLFGMGATDLNYSVSSTLYSVNLEGPPTWSQLTVLGVPPASRMLAAFCYDSGMRRMVLFSGFPTGQRDTWALDLTGPPNWVRMDPSGIQPSYQWSSALVYRGAEPSLWLYGGHNGADFYALWQLTSSFLSGDPVITDLVPLAGAIGDPVVIQGFGLSGVTSVSFNGIEAPIIGATETRVDTEVPPGATTGTVMVTTEVGAATSSMEFRVGLRAVATSLEPDSGRAGDVILLHGSQLNEATAVQLGGTGAATFTVLDDATLLVTVDSLASTGPVRVQNAFGTTSGPATFVRLVDEPRPRLLSVRDVRADQGGKVLLRWRASDFDQARYRRITGYRVWRRAPLEGDPGMVADAASSGGLQRWAPGVGPPEAFWESIAELPAAFLEGYAYAAATLRDSTESGNPFTAYFVQALTADPFEFYNSSPDSGYSVDDLAPPSPAPLTVNYSPSSNALHWRPSRVADLREYHLHRGGDALFTPSSENLIAATADTSYTDAPGSHFYKLAAVDIHGNLSLYVTVSPDRPVATLVSFYRAERLPGMTRVIWYSGGNAGLFASVQRRTHLTEWEQVGTVLADGTGFLVFEDRSVEAGTRYGYRLGVQEGGEPDQLLGETWVEPLPTVFTIAGRIPNPSLGGRITCSVTLPADARADLRLYDVSGREVARRVLEPSGGREQAVVFGDGTRLRAGVYVLRAVADDVVMTRRVVVLD